MNLIIYLLSQTLVTDYNEIEHLLSRNLVQDWLTQKITPHWVFIEKKSALLNSSRKKHMNICAPKQMIKTVFHFFFTTKFRKAISVHVLSNDAKWYTAS